eukprot:gene25924-31307_t
MTSAADQGGFDTLITIIFIFVALMLLFPLNTLVPVDRRLASMIGAVLCMMIIYAFPYQRDTNIGAKVDFGVLIILAAIMAINFVLLRQRWVKAMTDKVQVMIREDVNRGFWAVSIISMVASPFITNDGLCLMLVHPVLDAFKSQEKSDEVNNGNHGDDSKNDLADKPILGVEDKFCHTDPFYFMLTIACSANTGSAMTYTGNPQNIIVASYLSKYMNGGAFFALMVIPSLIGWVITAYTINQYRKVAAAKYRHSQRLNSMSAETSRGNMAGEGAELSQNPLSRVAGGKDSVDIELHAIQCSGDSELDEMVVNDKNKDTSTTLNHHVGKDGWDVITAPYIVLISIILIMALEFSGSVPLVGLFAFVSVVMVTSVIMYNYYAVNSSLLLQLFGSRISLRQCWRQLQHGPDNVDRRLIIKEFIEELFHDIDYNLLIIFIGLFVVSGSFLLTNIPQTIWTGIAGNSAFATVDSTISICVYIVLACQLIGNVPVVFMAEDNVSDLSRNAQIFGWLILAFVSTVAGNFTLVGSAANIIVAEKAMR